MGRTFQFGDWLDPDAPPDFPWKAKADSGVVATACLFRSATIAAETARLLGSDADAAEFTALAFRTRAAFNEHYVSDDGKVRSDCTTVYTLAIVFDLLDHETRALAGKRLAELVTESDYRVSTGFAGTPYITDALTRTGHLDDAYRLLLERGCPSWLYPVTMGATTIWERWDSMLPDGTINAGEMTSFNHYALGAVADWMHRTIGGLVPTQPGYQAVRIAPRPGGGLTWASTALETRHGRLEVSWRLEDSGSSSTPSSPRVSRRSSPWTAVPRSRSLPVAPRIRGGRHDHSFEDLLDTLDLEGKVRMLSGEGFFTLHGDPAIGLAPMAFSDGPTGSGVSSSARCGRPCCRTRPCSRPRGARTLPAK